MPHSRTCPLQYPRVFVPCDSVRPGANGRRLVLCTPICCLTSVAPQLNYRNRHVLPARQTFPRIKGAPKSVFRWRTVHIPFPPHSHTLHVSNPCISHNVSVHNHPHDPVCTFFVRLRSASACRRVCTTQTLEPHRPGECNLELRRSLQLTPFTRAPITIQGMVHVGTRTATMTLSSQ